MDSIASTIRYAHTQRNRFFAVIPWLVIATLPFLVWSLQGDPIGMAVVTLTLFLIAGVVMQFTRLTITVDNQALVARFGHGIFRKRVALDDIAATERVRNSWIYGWGIRWTPHGWLWNVSGLDGIEIETAHGKSMRFGTDDPDGLLEALRR